MIEFVKIHKLKINAYGKLKDKEIEFDDHINVIHGQNEAGKSTILNFIINMLYGISKNKNGKEYSDFEKYKPWDIEDFSGKIEYALDNKGTFEVLEILKRKIHKYLMKRKKIFLNNLILTNQKEMNSFMNKRKWMKNYFYLQL